MAKKENNFHKKLLSIFRVEAGEHIKAISSGLIEIEKAETNELRIAKTETVFREVHSLKGAARAVNMTEIETICQSFETVLSLLKSKNLDLSPELLDILHLAADSIGKFLTIPETEVPAFDISKIIQGLQSASKGEILPIKKEGYIRVGEEVTEVPEVKVYRPSLPQKKTFAEERSLATETIRISTEKLELVLRKSEQLISTKLMAIQHVAELHKIRISFEEWERRWIRTLFDFRSARRSFKKVSRNNGNGYKNSYMTKLFDFFEWNSDFLKSLENMVTVITRSAEQDSHTIGRMIDDLQYDMKKVLMFPFSSFLEVFPKLVRDLSRDQGKDVGLITEGADIEIDKRILEEMKAPLIHIVRNCIYHGIEKPEERAKKNKPHRGEIKILISHKNSSNIEIAVTDDGSGINIPKIKSAAAGLGIISGEEAERLDEREAVSLIFQSGVSTSPMVTDISGRGLGLTIVSEKVEMLGGNVSVGTIPDEGTTFRIILPLTIATFRGVIVRLDEQIFVIPMTGIERVTRVKKEDIRTVENRETILINGETAPLIRLSDVLELPQRGIKGAEFIPVFVLASAGKSIAFSVDEILYEEDVLVKNLPSNLSRVRNIAGATVLGTGNVIPILNSHDLIKSAIKVSATPGRVTLVTERAEEKVKSILVVEDSITARTLLRNILESAGYNVKTAVDGLDAFAMLRSEGFDLVVSDVDMPRLDGLSLTGKIRGDKRLSDLPVVLVTSLESREDREKGIDAGANAYIVKSSFDQSDLLEVIRRLI